MWKRKSSRNSLYKKLSSAPPGTGAATTSSGINAMCSPSARKLYWFKCKLNGQWFDALLDCAATVCCIARRCVSSNAVLCRLPVSRYNGPPILDANEKPLSAREQLSISFVAGTPALCLNVTMVIVDDLPYSCIIGTSLLAMLESWGVDNINSTLSLNSSLIHLCDAPQYDNQINLITSCKTSFLPGETKTIKTSVRGSGMSAARPYTQQLWMAEGITDREDRSLLRVFPSLNVIDENNENTTSIQITNTSNQKRTLGKGTKIAIGHQEYCAMESIENINVLNGRDAMDVLCNRKDLEHLSDTEFSQVKELLSEFRDIFVVSNEKIG